MTTAARLRAHAVAHALPAPTTLAAAIDALGFVQADPIRAPARAQDLVLRLRVRDYRAGDLEREYPALAVDEDTLYAYGFVPGRVRDLLHPRPARRLTTLERRVLLAVREAGAVHPRALEATFGGRTVENAWGGQSKATTHALERLHRRGLLRVARREDGIRVYEAAPPLAAPLPPDERLRRLVLLVAHVLAPVPLPTLRAIAAGLRRTVSAAPSGRGQRATLQALLRSGALACATHEGVDYLWPGASPPPEPAAEPPAEVRLLAPFDPLVWDRRRFEQLWGWSYRFEAYTPAAKRVRGYYALPLLWRERVIGWANASLADGRLSVAPGYVAGRPPRERAFRAALEREVERLAAFLGLPAP